MSKLILEHFSAEPLQPPRDFEQSRAELYSKPRGLWVSVRGEDDWLEWCKSENFRTDRCFKHRTVVHLAPDANLLWITNGPELLTFHKEFGRLDRRMNGIGMKSLEEQLSPDWSAVAERYDGIVIAPYQWAFRLDRDVSWYYPWDCASGCIWRTRAVDRLEEIEPPTFEEEEAEAAWSMGSRSIPSRAAGSQFRTTGS